MGDCSFSCKKIRKGGKGEQRLQARWVLGLVVDGRN